MHTCAVRRELLGELTDDSDNRVQGMPTQPEPSDVGERDQCHAVRYADVRDDRLSARPTRQIGHAHQQVPAFAGPLLPSNLDERNIAALIEGQRFGAEPHIPGHPHADTLSQHSVQLSRQPLDDLKRQTGIGQHSHHENTVLS